MQGDDRELARLKEILSLDADLAGAEAVLGWDREVNMPAASGAERASQIAAVARLRHEFFTSEETGRLLDALAARFEGADPLDDTASLIRVTRREYDKATKLPAEYIGRLTQATSLASDSWRKAKAQNDFSLFREDLKRIVDLTLEKAELLGYDEEPYDALLDLFEPDTPTRSVAEAFDKLKKELIPLIEAIGGRPQVDDAFFNQDYDLAKQWEFSLEILRAIGYDLERGRQDYSAHPFTRKLGTDDIRVTTWRLPAFKAPLVATIHEGGHAIHYQGLPRRFARTPLFDSPGLGISESQSRLFENHVGKSLPFWRHHYPRLQSLFPDQLGSVDVDAFYRAMNKVEPSFIRTQADELTYHLHIILRFELELELVNGALDVDRLPEAWNERMRAYLGKVPEQPSQGVLQDIHWSIGAIGYFPTYSLGSILAAHLFELATEERPEILDELAQGTCDTLRAWLGERIYSYGAKLTPPELVKAVTGGPLSIEPFIRYAKEKFGGIYGL